jgi:hypothetical protein
MGKRTFVIDRDTPPPSPVTHWADALDDLLIGECLVITPRDARDVKRLRCAATAHARRHGRRYTVRVMSSLECRCWRIE